MATVRKLNQASEQLIKQWENGGDGSPKLTAYLDSGGVWTIGTGHTGKVGGKPIRKGMKISEAVADDLFQVDIAWACKCISENVKVSLTDNQFGALVAWALNVGSENVRHSSLIKKLNAGHYNAVPTELMKWVKDRDPKTGKMVTVKGLVNRRAAEVGLWSKGSFVKSAISTPKTVSTTTPVPATRDVTAHVATGGLGAITIGAQPASDMISAVSDQQYELSSGDWIRIAIATIIILGTAYVVYRKFKGS